MNYWIATHLSLVFLALCIVIQPEPGGYILIRFAAFMGAANLFFALAQFIKH